MKWWNSTNNVPLYTQTRHRCLRSSLILSKSISTACTRPCASSSGPTRQRYFCTRCFTRTPTWRHTCSPGLTWTIWWVGRRRNFCYSRNHRASLALCLTSESGTIAKIAVKNESNWIVNPKQNALYNRWLQTWGMAMKSFHLGLVLWLSKQWGCMQRQLVLFCPDGTAPIILFNRVNLWRHFLNESQSSCATHRCLIIAPPKKCTSKSFSHIK